MATSKRTTRGTSTTRPETAQSQTIQPEAARPENGAAAPVKARRRTAKSRSGSSSAKSSHQTPDRHASIARAAYFRSQHRGFQPGYEVEDWLAAEAEVDQRLRGESRVSSGDSTD